MIHYKRSAATYIFDYYDALMRSFKKIELTFSRKLCVDPDDPTSLTRTQHRTLRTRTTNGYAGFGQRLERAKLASPEFSEGA